MKNKGVSQHRFKQNPLELKFALAWDKINNSQNCHYGTLDYLLASDTNMPSGEVSDRDRVVAATVIQWLGSPVGQSFLTQVTSDNFDHKQCNCDMHVGDGYFDEICPVHNK